MLKLHLSKYAKVVVFAQLDQPLLLVGEGLAGGRRDGDEHQRWDIPTRQRGEDRPTRHLADKEEEHQRRHLRRAGWGRPLKPHEGLHFVVFLQQLALSTNCIFVKVGG